MFCAECSKYYRNYFDIIFLHKPIRLVSQAILVFLSIWYLKNIIFAVAASVEYLGESLCVLQKCTELQAMQGWAEKHGQKHLGAC